MKKILKIDTQLTGFSDEVLKDDDGIAPLTLKAALLKYISLAHLMKLNGSDELNLYLIGRKIGKAATEVKLDLQEYNLLKRVADMGKVFGAQNQEQPIYTVVVSQQVRLLLEEAEAEKNP